MAKKHSIAFEVDASRVKTGATQFKTAINSITAALDKLEKTSSKTMSNVDKGFDGSKFKNLTSAVKAFNQTTISSSSLAKMQELATASKNFRAPTKAQSKNLSSFALALSKVRAPKGIAAVSRFAVALREFKPPTQRQTSNLKSFVNALHGLQVPKNARAIASALDLITGSASRASASLKGLRGSVSTLGMRKLSKESQVASKSVRSLGNSFSVAYQGGTILRNVLGSLTLGEFARSVFNASNAVQTFNVTMETVSGSAASARTDLAFVRKTATDLAIDLRTAQEQYASFAAASKVAGLEAATTRDIFKSVSVAMTVLNRSTQDQELSFLALQQMISKGTVSSEELRRQLGERLPGALEIMARALGVTGMELNKMLKAGTIISKEALPKFAKELEKIFGAGVPAALQRTSSQIKLLANDFEAILISIGESGFMDSLTDGVKELRDAVASPEFKEFTKDLGKGLGDAVSVVASGLSLLARNADVLKVAIQSFLALSLARSLVSIGSSFKRAALGASSAGSALLVTNKSLLGLRASSILASASVRTLSVSLKGLLAALGPVGVLFLGIEAAILAYSLLTEDAIEHTDSYAKILDTLGKSAESASIALADLSSSEKELLKLDLQIAIPDAESAAKKAREDLEDAFSKESRIFRGGFGGGFVLPEEGFGEFTGVVSESLRSMLTDFKAGEASVEDLASALTVLGDSSPEVVKLAAAMSSQIRALKESEDILKGFNDQQKLFTDSQSDASDSLKITAKRTDELGEGFKGTLGQVKSFYETIKRGGNTTKDLATQMESLKAAYARFNEEQARKPNLDAIKRLESASQSLKLAQTQLVTAEKSVTEWTIKRALAEEKLTKVSKDSSSTAIDLKRANAELAITQANLVKSQNNQEDANSRIISSMAEEKKATEDAIRAKAEFAKTLKDLSDDTSGLDRAMRELVSKALSKVAPEAFKAASDTVELKEAQGMLKLALDANIISLDVYNSAMKEAGIELETTASAGERAAKVLEDVQSKVSAAQTKKSLIGEELARFTATDRFRAQREELVELLNEAKKSGVEGAIEQATEALTQFDLEMESLGESAARAFTIKEYASLIVRNDKVAKSTKELMKLQELQAASDTELDTLAKKLGISRDQLNTSIQNSIELKSKEIDPTKTLLIAMDEELSLLKMTDEARLLATQMRAIELKSKKDGLDLTLEENAATREQIRLRQIAINEAANPKGIQATLKSIGTLDSALKEVDRKFSEDLIDAMSNLVVTGKFDFKSLADSIIADLARIAAQQLFKTIFGGVLKGVLGDSGGVLSSLFGAGKEGGISGKLPQQQRVSLSSFSNAPQFADGTANTSGGGIPSILHENEAVIPLSRNRKVPVEVNGPISGGKTTIVNNYFDIDVEESGEVEDRIKNAMTQTVPMIVEASRTAAMEDTAEMLQRRVI